jgi:uncharacterized protein
VKDGPQRTCIGCRQVKAKAELVRLVRGDGGRTMVDRRGSAPGRGAYTCPTLACLERTLVIARLARAFRGRACPPRESAAEILELWGRR